MAESEELEKQALRIWQRLYWQSRAGMALQVVLVLCSGWLLAAGIGHLFSLTQLYVSILFALISIVSLWLLKKYIEKSTLSLADYLNHRYHWLEFSTGLIPLFPEHPLQQLQRQRVLGLLVQHRQEISAWPGFKSALLLFAGAAALYAAGYLVPFTKVQSARPGESAVVTAPPVPQAIAGKLPRITFIQVKAEPPRYTRQKPFFAKELSLEAPEQSVIYWECRLDTMPETFQLFWNGQDTTTIEPSSNGNFYWKRKLSSALFYQIRYGLNGNWYTSPVYTLQVIDDRPPKVVIESPQPYTLVLFGQTPRIETRLHLSDDYGLANAQLVATVSRGSGEAVKFREEKLPFDAKVKGIKDMRLTKTLDFSKLQMVPGDELYFYAETWDEAIPPQKTRSDTYFVQWEDTTSGQVSVMAGLSLDNMPAYFRSQRQIIIDTEKLIKDSKTISRQAFTERSNNLGIDQKVLRLRYGQFLGEEFEITTGGVPSTEENHTHEEGHESEDHNGHEQGEEPADEALESLHRHSEKENTPVFGEPGNMLDNYAHRHDTEEAATLFDDAIKAQLKAALAQMWEAELRLRTMRPGEALPYEYKALALIKAIQQKSRVYVERVGFEPPPLKPAEKRLTGDLSEILTPQNTQEKTGETNEYATIRRAIALLEEVKHFPQEQLEPAEIRSIEEAGGRLAAFILQQPGIPVSTLNTLRSIAAGQAVPPKGVQALQQQLLQLLPEERTTPTATSHSAEPELSIFLESMKNK